MALLDNISNPDDSSWDPCVTGRTRYGRRIVHTPFGVGIDPRDSGTGGLCRPIDGLIALSDIVAGLDIKIITTAYYLAEAYRNRKSKTPISRLRRFGYGLLERYHHRLYERGCQDLVSQSKKGNSHARALLDIIAEFVPLPASCTLEATAINPQ